jgi:Domain of unknown function (DUF4352)/zinc-ribbon domain
MAEAPPRYCGNCGHELRPEDQFCPSCGRPVHEAATVPTPEADVPDLPPPPQQAGATTPPQQQAAAPTQGRSRGRTVVLGCLGIIGILILLGIIGAALGGGGDETAGGGGGNDAAQDQDQGQQQGQQEQQSENKPKPQPEYKVGQTATVGNVEWTVTDAYLTNQLRSGFGTQKSGRFVVVDFTFTNNRDEEVTLDPQLHMVLKDSQGREFGPDPDAWEFVPQNLNIFIEPVNPGVSKDGRVVYQVGADATGFTLTLDDVELMEDESAVFDLSDIKPRTYDTASPTATSTATAGQ